MSDEAESRRGRRRRPSATRDYLLAGLRAFTATCLVYTFVNALYALAVHAGIYQGAMIAGGTGILVGVVYEWLRRRRF